jgi:hypothetical protein
MDPVGAEESLLGFDQRKESRMKQRHRHSSRNTGKMLIIFLCIVLLLTISMLIPVLMQ